MKHLFFSLLIATTSYASFDTLVSIDADFTQTIKDEKNKVLSYSGHIRASKPQYALWSYTKPIVKDVYINNSKVTIIEPEIEQVIMKHIESNFDFFHLLKNAKKIDKNRYVALYKETSFIIITNGNLIEKISYTDEFENLVEIRFTNEKINLDINKKIFSPEIPKDFDLIVD